MKNYNASVFSSHPDWEKAQIAHIDSFHWEKEKFTRPESFAQLCAVENEGLYVRMWSFEENPRRVFTERDEPVYRDSCLEFFLAPLAGTVSPYINFEMNPNGVILSEFGSGRGKERAHLAELSEVAPKVTPFTLEKDGKTAWGVELFISFRLLSDITGNEFMTVPETLRGNFYKCGDDTEIPHFGAFSPVDTEAKGFHNPDRFAIFTFTKA